MAVSLARLDQELAAKRDEQAKLIDAKQNVYDKIDALASEIDALEADEKADQSVIDAKHKEIKALDKESRDLSEKVRQNESIISTLAAQRADREEFNARQANADKPQDRKTSSESASDNYIQGTRFEVKEATPEQKDHDISCWMRNSYIASQTRRTLSEVCSGLAGEQYRNDRLKAAVDRTGNPSLLPDGYTPRLIELLRPRSVVRSLPGVRQVPMPNGVLTMPRQTGATTANYVGEMTYMANSEITTDRVSLAAKKLTIQVVQSGEILRYSSPSSDAIIRDDMLNVLALKEDSTFIRAAGSSTVPRGIKAFADATNATQRITSNQTVTVPNVTTDLGRLILAIRAADTPMLNPSFILSPRSERWLMDARDGNGNFAFPEMARGRLREFPYYVTTQVPENLTTNTVTLCSEVYFLDASELIIGDAPSLELQVSDVAAYYDGSAVRSAYSEDSVVFRLIKAHDTAIRHPRSAAYLEQVIWGKA